MTLTQARLKELLHYDPETGVWTWLVRRKGTRGFGQRAGTTGPNRRQRIKIDGQEYLSYRLAWLYMTGEWPAKLIDHINGCQWDDRWVNLRAATHQQNQGNMKHRSGYKGVTKRSNRWYVACGRNTYVGCFRTEGDAARAYDAAAKKRFGEFALLNYPN